MGTVRIGVSGWRYPAWRGRFYPPGLVQRHELAYAAERFDAIEINASFYALQRPQTYARWRDETPDDFRFAVKGGRFVTHLRRLRDVRIALANFFASGVLALGPKLGAVLWQLPENLAFDATLLREFCALLPRTSAQASRLARGHDDHLKAEAYLAYGTERPLPQAIEPRHPSWGCDECVDLLRGNDIALVASDGGTHWPLFERVTAGIAYARLHGAPELYASGYSDRALDRWAATVHGWADGSGTPDGTGRDVYVFFDNDARVRAPFDASGLRSRLEAYA